MSRENKDSIFDSISFSHVENRLASASDGICVSSMVLLTQKKWHGLKRSGHAKIFLKEQQSSIEVDARFGRGSDEVSPSIRITTHSPANRCVSFNLELNDLLLSIESRHCICNLFGLVAALKVNSRTSPVYVFKRVQDVV